MPKKVVLKTTKTKASVAAFLNAIEDTNRRKDAKTISNLMKDVTGQPAKMWGDSIVGFDSYQYTRSNGDIGEFLALGFSPRKTALTLYIMPGYQNYGPLLKKLGPHKIGKSCLYLRSLDGIDMNVLTTLLKQGYQDLKKLYPVRELL